MAPVATIDLAKWPAVAGRAVYFAVEANVQTNLTGLTLCIDAFGNGSWASVIVSGGTAGDGPHCAHHRRIQARAPFFFFCSAEKEKTLVLENARVIC